MKTEETEFTNELVEETTRSRKKQSAQLRWMRLQTFLLAGVLALLVLAVFILSREIDGLHRSLELVETNLQELQMDGVNSAVEAMTNAANRLSEIDVEEVNGTVIALRAAASQLSEVDADTLNQSIAALRDAANTLKDLDIEAFNDVIQSLEKTSQNLEKISGGIGSIFG